MWHLSFYRPSSSDSPGISLFSLLVAAESLVMSQTRCSQPTFVLCVHVLRAMSYSAGLRWNDAVLCGMNARPPVGIYRSERPGRGTEILGRCPVLCILGSAMPTVKGSALEADQKKENAKHIKITHWRENQEQSQ